MERVTGHIIQPGALDKQQYEEELFAMEVVSVHKTVIFVSIVAGLCVTLIVTMLLVRHCQRKRFDPEFYKKDGQRNSARGGSQSAREEFSEIRYLTEDEHLDFSMATPSTFRSSSPAKRGRKGAEEAEEEAPVEEAIAANPSAAEEASESGQTEDADASSLSKKNSKLSTALASGKVKKSKKAQKKTPKEDAEEENEGLIVDDEDDGACDGEYANLQEW